MAPKNSQSPSRSKSPARATPKKKPAAAATPKKAAATPKKKPAPPAPAPHPTDVDLFASYSRLWAVSEAVIGYGTVYLVPGCHSFFPTECVETPWWFYSQCILWLIVLLYPSRFTVVASMLVRVAQYWAQAPMTWESCYWANATELAFVAILLLCPLDTVVYQSQDLIRLMMGWFYVGAGFWKINTSFLDTSVSCGPVYVASLLATFVPEILRPSWLVAYALKSAAWMTILGECGIGICLLMPSQLCKAKLVSDEICCSEGTAAGVTLVLDRLSDWRTGRAVSRSAERSVTPPFCETLTTRSSLNVLSTLTPSSPNPPPQISMCRSL